LSNLLKEAAKEDKTTALFSHPMLFYFGLLSSMTAVFGVRRDNREWLPFYKLKTLGDFSYHFSTAVETSLL
jgi:hypothetical protein